MQSCWGDVSVWVLIFEGDDNTEFGLDLGVCLCLGVSRERQSYDNNNIMIFFKFFFLLSMIYSRVT